MTTATACFVLSSVVSAGPPVLWENGPLVTTPAGGCDPGDGQGPRDVTEVQTAMGNNLTGLAVGSNFPARITDDFQLCEESTLDSILFHIWQSAIPGAGDGSNEIVTITGMTVRIWDGRPDDLASNVVYGDTATNVLTSAAFAFLYKGSDTDPMNCTRPIQECIVDLDPPLVLPPGRYWVDFDATGDALYGGPWIPPISDLDNAETGNCRQFFGGAWTDQTGGDVGMNPVGTPFVIFGEGVACVGCGGTPCPADIVPPNGNGAVDVDDLLAVLGNWGNPGLGDIVPNGVVDVDDLLAVLAAWGPCPPGPSGYTPPNDDMGNPLLVTGYGLQGYDLECATADGSASCQTGPDLWYSWTAPNTELVRVSVDESDYVAVYTAGGAELSCGQGNTVFNATAATKYIAQVIAGAPGVTNPTEMQFNVAPPPGDECVDAIPIFEGITAVDTTGATTTTVPPDENPECDQGSGILISNDLWYTYQATDTGFLTVSNCEDVGGSGTFDSDLMIYDGCGDCIDPPILGCNDDYPDAPCGADPLWHSAVTVPVVSGNCYLIRFGGWQTAADFGPAELFIDLAAGPINDVCAGATSINIGDTIAGSTAGLTEDSASGPCEGITPSAPGAWYAIVGDGTTITATTCDAGTDYDTILSIYCGECIAPTCVAANDEDFACFDTFSGASTVSFCAENGTTYFILVHGGGVAEGNFVLEVTSDGVGCAPTVVCP